MPARKVVGKSAVLGREWHADLFTLGTPRVLVVLFGGSGMTRAKYEERRARVHPLLDDLFQSVEGDAGFALAYVSAPHDVAFNRLTDDDGLRDRWNRHVEGELLPALPPLPLCMAGYSGGAALALHGAHALEHCIGAAALGGDLVPTELGPGPAWRDVARLYYNQADRVYGANVPALQALQANEVARVFRSLPGGHAFEDYVANESLMGLVRWALRLVEQG